MAYTSNVYLSSQVPSSEKPSASLFEQEQLLTWVPKVGCVIYIHVMFYNWQYNKQQFNLMRRGTNFLLSCLMFRKKGGRPNKRLFSYIDCDSYVNLDEVGQKKSKNFVTLQVPSSGRAGHLANWLPVEFSQRTAFNISTELFFIKNINNNII